MNIWLYILISALVAFLIRATPLVLIRREIRSRTLRSFLYYVPYVTLAVMTFPAIVEATESPLAGLLALVAGAALAWFGGSLFQVAVACCLVVFLGSCSWCDLPFQIARSRSQNGKNSPVPPYRRHRAVCFTPF